MTKADELEKEAEDYAEQYYGWTNNDYALDVAKATYIASAEPRENRIEELEKQIEKMKCCPNCDFIFRDGNCYYDKECKNKDHWKLKE